MVDSASSTSPNRVFTLQGIILKKCVRGVLGNKCAGYHNLKTGKIREIVWKQIKYTENCTLKLLRVDQLNELLRQQRLLKSVTDANPYGQSKSEISSGADLDPGSIYWG
jgi:hypothetical protein